MLFLMDEDGNIKHRFATYFGARLLTQQWLKPGDETHELYPAKSDVRDLNGNELITAYAVHRPDGLWSVLLINKDPKRLFDVGLAFQTASGIERLKKPFDVYQYSQQQYALGGPPKDPYPVRAQEPTHKVMKSSEKNSRIVLPPYSLTIVRGAVTQ